MREGKPRESFLGIRIVDGGRITYALDTGKLTSLKFPKFWFENTPQGKFMLNMAFSQSKYYVDALAENTKSGLKEKVRRGEFPCKAPIGYLNDYRTKKIIVDRKRAAVVKEAFELYATGAATLDRIHAFFAERGMVTSNGYAFIRGYVSNVLSNPFYYGHFRYNGEVHEGTYEPIITKALFDQVADVLNRRWRYSPLEKKSIPKPFLGLLHHRRNPERPHVLPLHEERPSGVLVQSALHSRGGAQHRNFKPDPTLRLARRVG